MMQRLALLTLLAGGCADKGAETTAPVDSQPPAADSDPIEPGDSQPPGPTLADARAAVHDYVSTILVVEWEQGVDADAVWIEFNLAGEPTRSTPQRALDAGARSEVLLGLPASSEVTWTLKAQAGGEEASLGPYTDSTGALPDDLLVPELVAYDPALASPEEWVLISFDTHFNGFYYSGPFYVLILDRQARVVWYVQVNNSNACMYPRVAYDGTHILFDQSTSYNFSGDPPQLRRSTLDLSMNEDTAFGGFVYGYTELPGGGFVRDYYERDEGFTLVEQSASGDLRTIWSCDDWIAAYLPEDEVQCYTNAVIWNEATDTVLWSLPYHDTVVEIARDSGAVVRVFGEVGATHTTVPAEALFDFQHYPNYTPGGTLMASMHIEGEGDQQRAREYAIDDDAGTLTEIWSYGEGVDEYAFYSGEASRLPNGNTLINYGTGGAAREVTHAGDVVWDITWGEWYLTGHMSLIEDLYALNRGR